MTYLLNSPTFLPFLGYALVPIAILNLLASLLFPNGRATIVRSSLVLYAVLCGIFGFCDNMRYNFGSEALSGKPNPWEVWPVILVLGSSVLACLPFVAGTIAPARDRPRARGFDVVYQPPQPSTPDRVAQTGGKRETEKNQTGQS